MGCTQWDRPLARQDKGQGEQKKTAVLQRAFNRVQSSHTTKTNRTCRIKIHHHKAYPEPGTSAASPGEAIRQPERTPDVGIVTQRFQSSCSNHLSLGKAEQLEMNGKIEVWAKKEKPNKRRLTRCGTLDGILRQKGRLRKHGGDLNAVGVRARSVVSLPATGLGGRLPSGMTV